MLIVMIATALATAAPPEAAPAPAIVVTANRSRKEAAAKKLAACRARQCPPAEDVNATLAFANAAFVDADYRAARSAVGALIRRIDEAAFPRLAAALWQAEATVAEHEGDMADAIGANRRVVHVLSASGAAGAAGAVDTVAARFDLGDALVRYAKPIEAVRAYAEAARTAEAAGLHGLRYAAEMRVAWLDYQQGRERDALAALERIVAVEGDGLASVRMAGRILIARVARARGDLAPTEAVLAALAAAPAGSMPRLIYSPPFDQPVPERSDPFDLAGSAEIRGSDAATREWIDVGYWVRPSGKVEDVEILRGSPGRGWARPVLAGIPRRVFAPFADESGRQGAYKVERYSLGHAMTTPTGSLTARRAGAGQITMIDLAKSDWPPVPGGGR